MLNMMLGMRMGMSMISRRLRGNKRLGVQETTDRGHRENMITRSTMTMMKPNKARTTIEVQKAGPTMTTKLVTSSIQRERIVAGREGV